MDNNQSNIQNNDTQGTENNPYAAGRGNNEQRPNSYQGYEQGFQANHNPYTDNRYTYQTQANTCNVCETPGQPYMNHAYTHQGYAQSQKGNGMIGISIAGMVCGIISILSCFLVIFNFILAVPGLIFSIVALVKNYNGKGMAIAGVICSAIGMILSTLYLMFLLFYAYV